MRTTTHLAVGDERTQPNCAVVGRDIPQGLDAFNVNQDAGSEFTVLKLHHQVSTTRQQAGILPVAAQDSYALFDALGRHELHDHRLQTAGNIDASIL
jgi:hypothetical protein